MKDRCYGGVDGFGRKNSWQECTACDGRIHKQDCTSKPNPKKDCCPARHIEKGINPNSAQVRKGA